MANRNSAGFGLIRSWYAWVQPQLLVGNPNTYMEAAYSDSDLYINGMYC